MTFHGIACCLLSVTLGFAAVAQSQTPQPFPRPGQPVTKPTQPSPPQPSVPTAAPPAQAPVADAAAPTEAQLGFPIYPAAQFIASYDAGRGQRYYLFGAAAAFAELVQYYRTALKEKGNLV